MDMWQAFMTSAAKNAPRAEIVHHEFHISKYLGEASTRCGAANRSSCSRSKDDRLTGSQQPWLHNPENLDEGRYYELLTLQRSDLKTGRAWAIKENSRHFREYIYAYSAKGFFDRWYGWPIRSRLNPIKKVVRMLMRHLDGLLS